MRVIVEPYNPHWPSQFLALKTSLQTALTSVPIIAIEHIGSTSVPGLAAKPIIDIDIIVSRPNLPQAIRALERAGFVYIGERGILDRHALREPGLALGLGHTCNTYLCVEGCLAVRNHIGVRDLLRNDGELREEYAAVKLELAEREFESVDEYAEAKTGVLQKILERVGIAKEELTEIEVANQVSKSEPTG